MSKPGEISLQQTLLVRDTCLCLATRRAARDLSRRFDEAFRPLGITSGQYSLLHALNRPDPPPLGAVAELMVMDRTTLSANVKPLARRGLVRTVTDPADRRVRRLSLTKQGREMLALAMPLWTSLHAQIDEDLDDPDAVRAGLAMLVARMRNVGART